MYSVALGRLYIYILIINIVIQYIRFVFYYTDKLALLSYQKVILLHIPSLFIIPIVGFFFVFILNRIKIDRQEQCVTHINVFHSFIFYTFRSNMLNYNKYSF
jgi:hypothetical protein